MNSRLSIFGLLWAAIAISMTGFGLAMRNGTLIGIGALMIVLASWNAAIQFKGRGL